jgi:flagellar hook-basal body complex protein FliE
MVDKPNVQSKLSVGKVIFMSDPDSFKIIPYRIVEKLVSEKLDGIEYFHIAADPVGNKLRLEDHDDIEWFMNVQEVRESLRDRANTHIEALCAEAMNVAQQKFSYSEGLVDTKDFAAEFASALKDKDNANDSKSTAKHDGVDHDEHLLNVVLDDGTKASISFNPLIEDMLTESNNSKTV